MELEKLFNKTAAQPPIYWKPLTADQVKVRNVTPARVRVPAVKNMKGFLPRTGSKPNSCKSIVLAWELHS
jgi:hypothetical protein